MDLVTPILNGVKITTQPDNTHHIILIAPSDMRADALYNGLGNNVVLTYIESDNPTQFNLSIELSDTQKYFIIKVNITSEIANLLDWIDENKVTTLWVGYLDYKGQISIYGQSIPLFPLLRYHQLQHYKE